MEENHTGRGRNKIWLGVLLFAVLLAVFFVCFKVFGTKTQKGEKSYTLVVEDAQGKEQKYSGSTEAEYLRDALEELERTEDFTLEGSESEYGLYIEKVNGVEASYEKNGAYWAIYVNGEYGQYSIDKQPVADGDVFKLMYEKNEAK